jgi:2-C-methyl-D-erythritol 4-phosphate cytidylyltransferase
MKTVAIITAGGMGLRLPGEVKKQFRMLNGKPLLIHTLEPFLKHPDINKVIVTLPVEDIDHFKALTAEFIKTKGRKKTLTFCIGGLQRQDSVYEALKICPANTEIVLIHDGVRPFVTAKLINELLSLALDFGAAIPAAPVKNTIKTVNGKLIDHTLRRDKLLKAFTPQVFGFPLIMKCYQRAMTEGYYSTDDAAILEHYGYSVHYLNDSSQNLKITDEFDFFLAEQIIRFNAINNDLRNNNEQTD